LMQPARLPAAISPAIDIDDFEFASAPKAGPDAGQPHVVLGAMRLSRESPARHAGRPVRRHPRDYAPANQRRATALSSRSTTRGASKTVPLGSRKESMPGVKTLTPRATDLRPTLNAPSSADSKLN
jgi:hypothetical protein